MSVGQLEATGDVALDFDLSAVKVAPRHDARCRWSAFVHQCLPESPAAYWTRLVSGGRQCAPYTLPPLHRLLQAFIGALIAILILGAIAQYGAPSMHLQGMLGSMGATSVLLYAVPESPLSQPRNVILGNVQGAIWGLAFSYCWTDAWGRDLRWIAGALANAVALVSMQLTNCVHPPAGATAMLIAISTDPLLGNHTWLLVLYPVLGGFAIMVIIACIVDNVWGQYPRTWL